jgi:hypothetical protein
MGGRALTSGPRSVSDRGRECANRAGQALEGNEWLQWSESFDQDRTEGGPRGSKPFEGVRAVRSRSDGGKFDWEG